MIKKITHKFKLLVLLVATLFVSNSCSNLLNNPLQDKETGENLALLLLDLNVFDTKINIHLIDEATGQYITEDQVLVSFDGEDVDKVVDPGGKKKIEYTVKNGILEIAVDPSFTPSESNPLDLHVNAGTAEPKWHSFGEEILITAPGQYDIQVNMIAEGSNDGGSEDFEGGEDTEIELIPFLKSTSTTLDEPPFKLSARGLSNFTKTNYIKPITASGVTYYYYIAPKNRTAVVKSATLTASGFTGDSKLISDWGFNGKYTTTKTVTLKSKPLTRAATYTNFKNYRFEAGVVNSSLEKCAKGLTINIKESSGKAGSAEFDYILKTKKNGTIIKKSKITANFNALNNYTATTTISPIYYPKDDQAVVLELSTTGTYDIAKSTIEFSSPCDQKADFTVTPKIGLKPYLVTTSLSCQAGGVGGAPTMRGTVSGPGLDGDVPFTFSGGTATLNLLPNEDYNISGSYNGTSASFGLTTKKDAASIQNVINNTKSSYPELYNLTLSVSDNSISIGVVFTTKDCPFN